MDSEVIENLIKKVDAMEPLFRNHELVKELIKKSNQMVKNKIEKIKLDNEIERIVKELKRSENNE